MTAHLKLLLNGLIISCAIVALGSLNFAGFILVKKEWDQKKEQLVERSHQLGLAYELQVNFKVQVQEWKNVLLRGHREADFQKYHHQFQQRSRTVQAKLDELIAMPSLDDPLRRQAVRFRDQHLEIGKAYHKALSAHSLGDPSAPFRIDAAVRGIDRPPMLLLDQLVSNIAESTRADTLRMEREMAWIVNGLILLSAVCLLVAIALVGYFILDRRRYERQLARAIERADQANRAKSRFLAHMSHEIRTPMNGIVAAIDLLKESDLSSQGNEALEVMETSSESLTAIVNDILDLSKIEAGRINLRCEPLELNGFLRILEKSVLPVAQNKGLELVFDWPREQNLVIESDPVRLRQILLNLLSNAIKFTESGRVSLKAVCEESETRARIAFEITDTGIGIPPEKQDLLFKAFSQVDNSLTRQHQGTGLGLVISKAIVQSMKGRIAFHSKVGVGTTFTVTLSFPRLARRAEPEASPGDILYFSGKPLLERVLLVDDVKSNLLVTSRLLQKLNIPADLAESGPEAIRLARQTPYGLILMDCQMPGMDGYEAAGHIRHEARSRGQPVVIVALTAHAMDEHRRESENQGMDDHLGKPLRLKTLESCLLQFFRLPDRNENAQPQHQKPSGPRFQDSTASGGRQLTMSL